MEAKLDPNVVAPCLDCHFAVAFSADTPDGLLGRSVSAVKVNEVDGGLHLQIGLFVTQDTPAALDALRAGPSEVFVNALSRDGSTHTKIASGVLEVDGTEYDLAYARGMEPPGPMRVTVYMSGHVHP